MSTKKKPAYVVSPFLPTDDHQTTLGDAHHLLLTIAAYGKVITGNDIDPADSGLSHPHGGAGTLTLALIYGVFDGVRCHTLAFPEKVYLPAPDGPADGCDWDAARFVVWKNLPRDWNTIHVQTTKCSLAAALGLRDLTSAAPLTVAFLSDVLCLDWVGLSATVDNIDDGQTIQTFWEHNHKTAFTFNEQVSLSNAIRQRYARIFAPQKLVASTKISDLENWIPATL